MVESISDGKLIHPSPSAHLFFVRTTKSCQFDISCGRITGCVALLFIKSFIIVPKENTRNTVMTYHLLSMDHNLKRSTLQEPSNSRCPLESLFSRQSVAAV